MEPAVEIRKNVVFGKADAELLTADLYWPAQQSDQLPPLVLIHGGAYQTGSKEMYADWGGVLAAQGYFVMAINYRLAKLGRATYPGVLDDLSACLNWLVSNAETRKIDPNRIGLIGDSAGAHLAALLALTTHPFSHKICAVVGVYGIYDLVAEWSQPVSVRAHGMFEWFLGCSLPGHEELYQMASPIHHVRAAADDATFDVHFLLIWGAVDKVVHPRQSRLFEATLRGAEVDVECVEVPDFGHFWFNQLPGIGGGAVADAPNASIYPALLDFLDRKVKRAQRVGYSVSRLRALAAIENL